jgi:beta-mannanase
MNLKDSSGSRDKQSIWQMAIAVFMIGFPLVMLFFNTNRAVKGITWSMPQATKTTLGWNQQESNETRAMTDVRISVPDFGVYDPESKFKTDKSFGLEQVFCSWINPDVSTLHEKIKDIFLNNRTPLVTIEPWNGTNDEKTLMEDILKGKYDGNISNVMQVFSGIQGNLYLSWGHEMDQDLTKRYPWSGSDPKLYVSAYRYVTEKFKKGLNNKISWIWSPVGKEGCERYWPGPGYVDYIGIPIYSYPQWDKQYYGHIRSFKSWYDEKYRLIGQFKKPVIIVEFGVTGSLDYQTFWLQEAFNTIKVTPSIEMILFFYAKDEKGSWGKDIETPDWRSNPEVITGLIKWIKAEK